MTFLNLLAFFIVVCRPHTKLYCKEAIFFIISPLKLLLIPRLSRGFCKQKAYPKTFGHAYMFVITQTFFFHPDFNCCYRNRTDSCPKHRLAEYTASRESHSTLKFYFVVLIVHQTFIFVNMILCCRLLHISW